MTSSSTTTQLFHWADYLVFVAFLVVTILIGIFFGLKDRKKMTSKNFLTGGGSMHWSVVALSMQASFLSAIFIVSIPIEVYAWGTMYSYLVLAYFVALPFAGHFILPVYYKLNVTSAYEYLEKRFNKVVRTACALTFVLQTLLYMSVVLYTPALALAQVTGLSIWLAILICGLVCTFYTFAGGMKATIWNDFFQMLVIALTLLLMLIFGIVRVGSMSKVWQISVEGGRIEFDNFSFDPTMRTSFWTQTVGGFFVNLVMYAANQTTIQKYISVKTLADAKKSVWMAAVTTALFLILVCLIGLVAYAYYATCDPFLEGRITKYDQLIPLYVMDIVGHLHGLPGLFIAATFSAALSSLSGSLNALSAVTLTDFINPAYKRLKNANLDEKARAVLSRALTLFYGILITGLGFAAQFFGEVLFQIAFSIFGFVGGPLTFTVVLGVFFPFVNNLGALLGLISSFIVTSWIAVGAIIFKVLLL
ncbi:hypothetical protein HELRODRAFT_83724 [Helobdella robusta]|uniref:Sodium/solute symporter n=1 Tax=Helobdella robusta TaxID=6412 RepID=T1G596_HELRO|nr:hypothetical protein HELRODRAFT_83724 [Helobdella robusta]ESO00062.1 hypothetical protein HELRODRAFT_83724 [Helobdella robusta]